LRPIQGRGQHTTTEHANVQINAQGRLTPVWKVVGPALLHLIQRRAERESEINDAGIDHHTLKPQPQPLVIALLFRPTPNLSSKPSLRELKAELIPRRLPYRDTLGCGGTR
jgi:hypothetical protein